MNNIIEKDGKRFVEHEGLLVPLLFAPLEGPQTWFMEYEGQTDNLFYGGARGGGKTECLIALAAKYGHIPGYRCLYMRRTHPRLIQSVERARMVLTNMGWRPSENSFKHESGAIIRYGHCQYEADRFNYQGHEYQKILFDELTEFTKKIYEFMATCCRSTIPDIKAQMIGTGNPGGVGHLWVKKMYVDRCKPVPIGGKVYNEEFDVTWQPEAPGKVYTDEEGLTYQFVPAKVFDNKYIIENDKAYVLRLKKLPQEVRKAHLDGSWDVFVGQFFGEWNPKVHVVDSFKIPLNWPRYVSLDFGSSAPFVGMFHTVDPYTGELYTYDEYWAKGQSLRYHAAQIALRVANEPKIDMIIYPHDMHRRFSKEDADFETMIDTFKRHLTEELDKLKKPKHLRFDKAVSGPNTRVMGWNLMREALAEPWWRITKDCKMLIQTLPYLIHDEKNPDDVQECDEDHWAEASRNGLVHIKRSPTETKGNKYEFKKKPQRRMTRKHWMVM